MRRLFSCHRRTSTATSTDGALGVHFKAAGSMRLTGSAWSPRGGVISPKLTTLFNSHVDCVYYQWRRNRAIYVNEKYPVGLHGRGHGADDFV
ncbi:hypothetical protein C8Q76DRAFT_261879 [Earliella scabrosa]|nr:hypothetical protein C8Q76DRAFT_261879 [Earliella scabrosa]